MISVIVPVYNVEQYLRKCLDSIVNQTYEDLEILIIDDGSTDGSGRICDEYKRDERVRVLHTNNCGLSAARNLGLDEAKGEWIGFVDSDDWIESNMFGALFRRAEEARADVVECGFFADYTTASYEHHAIHRTVSKTEAVEALIKGRIRTQVWNKIWKTQLFNEVRFPEGRNFEDIATVYRLIRRASTVTGIDEAYYHWRQRISGIARSHDRKNLVDDWLAHKQRYEDLKDCANSEVVTLLLRCCAYAIARVWAWNLKSNCPDEYLREMNEFARKNYPLFGYQSWSSSLRICFFLARFNNRVSFTLAYVLNQFYRALNPNIRNTRMSE